MKLVDKYAFSNILSTESNVNIVIGKAWTAMERLLIIWKPDLSDQVKWEFFQAVAVSVPLYSCATWTLMKHLEKKLHFDLYKDTLCCFEQILEASPLKTAAVRLLSSHLTNHSIKINKTHKESGLRSMDELMNGIP